MSTWSGAEKYNYHELYDLWLRFKGDIEVLVLLSDFAVISIGEARELDKYFREKYDADQLNISSRGVKDCTRKHIQSGGITIDKTYTVEGNSAKMP